MPDHSDPRIASPVTTNKAMGGECKAFSLKEPRLGRSPAQFRKASFIQKAPKEYGGGQTPFAMTLILRVSLTHVQTQGSIQLVFGPTPGTSPGSNQLHWFNS